MKDIPYAAFSFNELREKPFVAEGHMVTCLKCGKGHPLICGTSVETGEKTSLLMFYTCGDKTFLGAVDGRLVI